MRNNMSCSSLHNIFLKNYLCRAKRLLGNANTLHQWNGALPPGWPAAAAAESALSDRRFNMPLQDHFIHHDAAAVTVDNYIHSSYIKFKFAWARPWLGHSDPRAQAKSGCAVNLSPTVLWTVWVEHAVALIVLYGWKRNSACICIYLGYISGCMYMYCMCCMY